MWVGKEFHWSLFGANNGSLEYTKEFLFPYTLRLVESSAQGPKDDSIGCLFLAIGLGMFNRGDEVLDA